MTLSILRKGAADPTFKVDDDGTVWRGIRTPQGTATLRLRSRPADGEVHVSAWGDGAEWALDSVPVDARRRRRRHRVRADTTRCSPTRTAASRTGGSAAPAW